MLSCVSRPFEPPYEYGRIDSAPAVALACSKRDATSSSAASHVTRVN
jgi:hypothetical protein